MLFTKEYLVEYLRVVKAAETAEQVLNGLKKLKLANDLDTMNKLTILCDDAVVANKRTCRMIYNMVPQELRDTLTVGNISGCFITDITGDIAFDAQICLRIEGHHVRIKYSPKDDIIYTDILSDSSRVREIFEGFVPNDKNIDSWIRHN